MGILISFFSEEFIALIQGWFVSLWEWFAWSENSSEKKEIESPILILLWSRKILSQRPTKAERKTFLNSDKLQPFNPINHRLNEHLRRDVREVGQKILMELHPITWAFGFNYYWTYSTEILFYWGHKSVKKGTSWGNFAGHCWNYLNTFIF